MRLFDGIYTTNEEQRTIALEHIGEVVRSWAEDATGVNEQEMLQQHLRIVLRMATNCPFDDVRARFGQLLHELSERGVRVPRVAYQSPSLFIAASQLPSLSSSNAAMTRCFVLNGRFSHVYRLMAYFPSYLEAFMQTFNQVLRLPAPLPRAWRNYIAIMAASQHHCQYLVSLQEMEFLHNGGDDLWLRGLEHAPRKLRNLAHLNALMAHQPWRITKHHISALVRANDGNDNWSKSELVLAIVLMATFHSLCSFVLGCGITPEIDMRGGTFDPLPAASSSSPTRDNMPNVLDDTDTQSATHTAQLIERLQRKEMVHTEASQIAREELFETLETHETFSNTSDAEHSDAPSTTSTTATASNVPPGTSDPHTHQTQDCSRYLGPPSHQLHHVDFNVKSTEYSIFRLQDYNWEEHGSSLVNKFLRELGEMLDSEFSAILNLTDYSLFTSGNNGSDGSGDGKQLDTGPFRRAVWYYVLRLAGMCHDDYNYHEVNIYLNKRIKQYIKIITCYPERLTANPSYFHNMGFQFRPDEKCHINLLASESRKCAELLYALHAMMGL